MKIHTIAHIGDDETAKEWVQLVRKFDIDHPGECHIQICIDAPQSTVADMEQLIDAMDPPLLHRLTIKKKP